VDVAGRARAGPAQQDRHHDGDPDGGRVVGDMKPAQELKTCRPIRATAALRCGTKTRRCWFHDRTDLWPALWCPLISPTAVREESGERSPNGHASIRDSARPLTLTSMLRTASPIVAGSSAAALIPLDFWRFSTRRPEKVRAVVKTAIGPGAGHSLNESANGSPGAGSSQTRRGGHRCQDCSGQPGE
jgi:hypothetical protein